MHSVVLNPTSNANECALCTAFDEKHEKKSARKKKEFIYYYIRLYQSMEMREIQIFFISELMAS